MYASGIARIRNRNLVRTGHSYTVVNNTVRRNIKFNRVYKILYFKFKFGNFKRIFSEFFRRHYSCGKSIVIEAQSAFYNIFCIQFLGRNIFNFARRKIYKSRNCSMSLHIAGGNGQRQNSRRLVKARIKRKSRSRHINRADVNRCRARNAY